MVVCLIVNNNLYFTELIINNTETETCQEENFFKVENFVSKLRNIFQNREKIFKTAKNNISGCNLKKKYVFEMIIQKHFSSKYVFQGIKNTHIYMI